MHTINKETLAFLKDLREHNDRDWFTKNKPRYELAKDNVKSFTNELMKLLNDHDHIESAKVFRIYRDVRFSKDKTPYKTNIGCGFTRATEKLRGGLYLNIEPGNTFVGGGFWGPNASDLKRIRNEFLFNADPFRKIITSKKFKEYFGTLKGDELKTAPKGFDKQHPNIDLIRKKQFLIGRDFTDKEMLSKDFLNECNETFKAMRPFFDFMSETLTTNENGESII
ncbi:MAG: DUF2461 domain-containing protein [Saprospiraceae bacterium]|nr:DUF2461 domain-containing protein [Saprospiraceae bacterium]